MAVQRVALDVVPDFEVAVFARLVREVSRLAADEAPVSLAVRNDSLPAVFGIGDVRCSARCVRGPGKFPNPDSLVPARREHELLIRRAPLLDAVERLGRLSRAHSPQTLDFADAALAMSISTPDVGEAIDVLAVPFRAERLLLAGNSQNLRDGFAAADADEVVLRLSGEHHRLQIESADASGYSYMMGLMVEPSP